MPKGARKRGRRERAFVRRREESRENSSSSLKLFTRPHPKNKNKKTAASSKSSSSLKPITMGACLMLAALQARHLWQERPRQHQGQEGAPAAATANK